MKLSDLLYLSAQNFRVRKSRTFLTILGVSVGIGAVLFLVSLGYGLQHVLLERITTEESLLTLDVSVPEGSPIVLNQESINKISKIKNVEKISPQAVFPAQVSLGNFTSESTINIVDPDFFSLSGISPDEGRLFSNKDKDKIVINSTVADLFNESENEIIGKELKFSFFMPQSIEEIKEIPLGRPFKVVGVIQGEGSPAQVYFRKADLSQIDITDYQLVKVKVKDSKKMESVRSQLINMGFTVSALSDVVSQANKIFRAMKFALGAFGIIALVVAAIGLVNTMTVTLLQRVNEIGIMRAIGASPSDIKKIFLADSTIIGFLGGLGGIIIGIAGSEFFNMIINILARRFGGTPVRIFVYPLWFMLFIIILSTFVGFLSGVMPARKAARLNPLEALRYK